MVQNRTIAQNRRVTVYKVKVYIKKQMFKLLKEYPSLISAAFKRYPLAIAFAFLSSIAFCYLFTIRDYNLVSIRDHLFPFWATFYPVAAMLIALTTSLIQESRKSTRKTPQILTSVSWLVISFTLSILYVSTDNFGDKQSIGHTIIYIYCIIGLAACFGPFWNQKNDNALWFFHNKICAPVLMSFWVTVLFIIVTFALLVAIIALSNGSRDPGLSALALTFFFSVFTIFPVLCMAGIPSIDKCIEENPTLKNFTTTIKLKIRSKQFSFSFDCFKHIFIPLYAIYIVVVHIYDITALQQWNLPTGTIFSLAYVALICVFIIQNEYYPAIIKPERSSEKTIARVLSYTCIFPFVTATIAIIQRISEYGITPSRFNALAFCIFLCIVVILDCITKTIPSKYVAIILCVIATVSLIGPFSETNIIRNAWLKNIEKTLVNEGYTAYPLSEKEAKNFFSNLWEKDGHTASIIAYQVKKLHYRSIEKLYQYFPEKSDLADISKKYPTINKTVENDKLHTMPENFSKFAYVDYTFKHEDLVTRNDTLFFDYPLKDIDSTSSKVFSFYVPKQNWLDKDIKVLETEGARFEVEFIKFAQWENEKHQRERGLRLRGMLFME